MISSTQNHREKVGKKRVRNKNREKDVCTSARVPQLQLALNNHQQKDRPDPQKRYLTSKDKREAQ